MVVVGGLVGAGALGYDVVAGFSQGQLYGKGLAAGVAIVVLGDHARPHHPGGGADARMDRTRKIATKWQGMRARHRGAGVRAFAAGRVRRGEGRRRRPGRRQSAACGTFNLAVNPWVGYEANAAVIAYVAEKNLGCKVIKKDLKEEVAWQGFGTGEVDAIVENWGHDDLRKKYIDEQKIAVEPGSTGNKGQIGWYVPPWLAKQYPDILDWKNLNKYAEHVQDLGVRRQGPAAGRRPVVRHQRRGSGQEPGAELQGGLRAAARPR